MITLKDLEQEAEKGCGIYETGNQLRDYVYDLSEQAFLHGDRDRDAIRTREALQNRQQWVKERFLDAIGREYLAPIPAVGGEEMGVPPHSLCCGCLEEENLCIEKLVLVSRTGVYVTANLYLPKGRHRDSSLGGVLFVCGHDPEGKQAEEYQRACRYLSKAGMAVLIMDSVGQGERAGYYEKGIGAEVIGRCTREHDYTGFSCMAAGGSMAEYLLYDAVKALDYLCSRPEVDEQRIGITGNSGGGTLCAMLMMTQKRIKAAAPGTFITSRKHYQRAGQVQDNEQIWRGLSALGIDHEDILLCMAPRPVMILGAEYDFFTPEGTWETIDRSRRYFALCGEEENLEYFFDASRHAYTAAMAERAAEFFQRHLGIKSLQKAEISLESILGRQLWCTQSGRIQAEYEDACTVWQENRDRVRRERKAGNMTGKGSKEWLREQMMQNRKPGKLYIRKLRDSNWVLDMRCESLIWNVQDRMVNHGFLLRSWQRESEILPVTIALWDGGCLKLQEHAAFIQDKVRDGRAVLVLDLTGMGSVRQREFQAWPPEGSFYGASAKLNDDLIWLNDSLMGLRIFDLIRSTEVIREWPQLCMEGMTLYTEGKYSLYAEAVKRISPDLFSRMESRDAFGSIEAWIEDKYYNPYDIAAFVIPGMAHYIE